MLGASNPAWPDQLTAWDGTAIDYDPIGNPLHYKGYTLTWDHARQLVGVVGNGKTISYTYDAQGRRTSKTVNGVTTTFDYMGDLLVRQSDGTNHLWFTYDANGKLLSFNKKATANATAGTVYDYRRNAQGDITGFSRIASTVYLEYAYDAWGNPISKGADPLYTQNPFRYRGYYYDEETGFYFLNSRYYDPEVKRFINADCLFIAGNELTGANMYAYCNGNPVMLVDPSGMAAGPADGQAVTFAFVTLMWRLLWTGPNDQEKLLIMEDPVTALSVLIMAGMARSKTTSIFGNDVQDGSKGNAFQHAYWSALMARSLGVETAAKFSAAHEGLNHHAYNSLSFDIVDGVTTSVSGPWSNHTVMDMYNNLVGFTIGELAHTNPGGFFSVAWAALGLFVKSDLESLILIYLNSGLLVDLGVVV